MKETVVEKDFPFMVVISVLTDHHLTQNLQEELDLVLFLGVEVILGEERNKYRGRVKKALFNKVPWLKDEKTQDSIQYLLELLKTPNAELFSAEIIVGWHSLEANRLERRMDASVTICQ